MSTASEIPFIVKICGITNEQDAAMAVEAGANALGFNFYPGSPRYITLDRACEIVRATDKPFLRVGVFVNPSEAQLAEAAQQVALDVVQLHGNTCPVWFSNVCRVWKSIVVTGAALSEYTGNETGSVDAYVLDTPTPEFGGSGRSFNWSLAAQFAYRKIIAGGLDPTNVAEAIQITSPWGVDACSRLESGPGRKNAHRVREFVRAALVARSQERFYDAH
jgi:phosphoribosylanthranilate isomerase